MTSKWPLESKYAEALQQAVRYARQRAVDLHGSHPEDAREWETVADDMTLALKAEFTP